MKPFQFDSAVGLVSRPDSGVLWHPRHSGVGQGTAVESEGERLFAAYLRQRRLASQREPLIGGRRPDYLVEHSDRIFAAEVYEPELHLPPGGGRFDSYPALRRAFQSRKADQAKAMREAGIPCVVVLARTNSDVRYQPEIVAGAMFGNMGVRWRLNDSDAEPQTIFRGGGRVQPNRNRGVSAVAILECFNPTLHRAKETVADRLGDGMRWHPGIPHEAVVREQGAILSAMREVEEHMTA